MTNLLPSSPPPVTLRAMRKDELLAIKQHFVQHDCVLPGCHPVEEIIKRRDEISLNLTKVLAAYEEQVRHNATAIEIIRTLSDNPATENSRATGRTARLALRALIALSAGEDVAVVGLNDQHALEMKLRIEKNAMKWRIPYDGGMWAPRESRGERAPMVRAFTMESERSGFKGVVLVDHAVVERMEAVAGVEASSFAEMYGQVE